MFKKKMVLYQANAGGGGGNGGDAGQTGGEGGTESTLTFDTWHESLPAEHKGLIENHTKALKNALESERGSRKDFEKQVRDLAKAAEKGSEAEKQLTKLADDLQSADRKADFYEAAHSAGVKNLKLAHTVAVSDDLFDKHGRVNFDEMKKKYPELFTGTTTPAGNAGSGTGGGNNQQRDDMSARIRRAAGRE